MKKTILAVAFALTGTILVAQQSTTPAAPAGDPVIMKSGSVEVRQSEFEQALNALPAEYQSFAAGPGKRRFAEDYLRLRLLAAEAEENGLANDPKVKSQLELLRANTLANAQIEKMRASISISDADLRKAYEESKAEFERAKARHILIAFEGSPAAPPEGALSEEAALAKAEEIRSKIEAGADFAELAKAESHDTQSGANGGDLGEFTRGQMVPEFDAAVFSAKPGDLAPVVRTQFGYHVIQVQEKGTVPFEEVKDQLDGQLRQQQLEVLVEAIQGSDTTFSDDYFGAPVAAAAPTPGE
ncbi:MAG: peptidylprolyl isomerase [Thermoanaerobaculia bacterium]